MARSLRNGLLACAGLSPQLPKPRVDAWREALFIGDARQEIHELRSLLVSERSAQRIVVCARDPSDLPHRLLALGCQVERIDAPVLWVIATLDEPPFLQFVHEDDEPARQNCERCRESLLAEPRARRDRPQHPGVRPGQLQRGKSLPEPRRRVTANLGEQKRR